jgi:hypothetical protein
MDNGHRAATRPFRGCSDKSSKRRSERGPGTGLAKADDVAPTVAIHIRTPRKTLATTRAEVIRYLC